MRPRKAISGRYLSAVDIELEVLDPSEHGSYGSQTLIRCIDCTMNHDCCDPAFRSNSNGKKAYVGWRAMVDVVVRWMSVGGQGGWGGWKIIKEGGRGIPHSFPVMSVAIHRPFSIVSRN